MADAPPPPPPGALPSLKHEGWPNGGAAPVAVKAEPHDAAPAVGQAAPDGAAAPDGKPALESAVKGVAKRPAEAMEREEEGAEEKEDKEEEEEQGDDARARAAPAPTVPPPTGVVRNTPAYEHLLEVKRRVETALELDHVAVLRPNLRPFTSFEDVVERLLPYHVFYHTELDAGDLDEPDLKHGTPAGRRSARARGRALAAGRSRPVAPAPGRAHAPVIAQEEAVQARLAAVVKRARRLAAHEAQVGDGRGAQAAAAPTRWLTALAGRVLPLRRRRACRRARG